MGFGGVDGISDLDPGIFDGGFDKYPDNTIVSCDNDSYITRIYGNKTDEKITRLCGICSNGKIGCDGTDTLSPSFSFINPNGINNIKSYANGVDISDNNYGLNSISLTKNDKEYKYGGTNTNNPIIKTCENGKVITEMKHHIWANNKSGMPIEDIVCSTPNTLPNNILKCPYGKFITRLEGKSDNYINKLCGVCSGGTNAGCIGAYGGGNDLIIDPNTTNIVPSNPYGINKLETSYDMLLDKEVLKSIKDTSLYHTESPLFGKISQNKYTFTCPKENGESYNISELQIDYTDEHDIVPKIKGAKCTGSNFGKIFDAIITDSEGNELNHPETPSPETPSPETPNPETPNPETPNPETPNPETPSPETPLNNNENTGLNTLTIIVIIISIIIFVIITYEFINIYNKRLMKKKIIQQQFQTQFQ